MHIDAGVYIQHAPPVVRVPRRPSFGSKMEASSNRKLDCDSRENAVLDRPIFRTNHSAIQVTIFGSQNIAPQSDLHKAVDPDLQIFIILVVPPVDEFERALRMRRRVGGQIHRHSAMPDTSAVSLDCALDAEFLVNSHAMFVAPEPQYRSSDESGQLQSRLGIPFVES